MELMEKLQAAYKAVQGGDNVAAGEAVLELKALPKTTDGIFDLKKIGGDEWEAACVAYPVYVAYETVCNKKEGYPDLIAQMRVWNKRLEADFSFSNAVKASDMWIHTLRYMSPEIYEYYRELADIFKGNVRRTLDKFYGPDASGMDEALKERFREAVLLACDADILLAEKYADRV